MVVWTFVWAVALLGGDLAHGLIHHDGHEAKPSCQLCIVHSQIVDAPIIVDVCALTILIEQPAPVYFAYEREASVEDARPAVPRAPPVA